MSYLLIGNISALIGHDCVEPLVNARIRVYLPALQARGNKQTAKDMFSDMQPLSAKEVLLKADRLIAEAVLDSKGNFSLSWNEVHLFTEELELDLCLDQLPGKNGSTRPRNFHLSRLVLHWKRNNAGYVGAYAYVIPADIWQQIYANAGAWVVTGLVKEAPGRVGQPGLMVEAYNALNDEVIGKAYTNETGRYYLYFSRKEIGKGRMITVRNGQVGTGPQLYFKIYRDGQLVWEENKKAAEHPERKELSHCSQVDIVFKPSRVKKASDWLSELMTLKGTRKKKSDAYRLLTYSSLL
ncbi:hypothetical protein SAMN05660909_01878 [Chitinophaga terrae (ex Kim and Jung 2007)]|uniref:Carboxypeptidase regulatory-like domain-containing protein n=1 Tax=Chitinophaga terrae (ex Kim and Jung 2007) TaxID=408074 RepID=A0A1H4B4F6_9BACT|nr:hypothetical protein [Chitinophaga terrae (ex Kim and Jung 2007)]GEP91150.1 hypothetical protein CTE07_27950 [Chitinophaga terrae (ex Kim and Jung 2007)]SEA43050.1 hypothetical protein SAMN05660909_01878 [Chitinophaga terrae (ex Kim and Jung 2007)]